MDRQVIRLAHRLREAVIAQADRTLGARAKPDWRIGELMDRYEGHCRRAEKAQKRGWAEATEHFAASAHRVLQELLGQVQLLTEAGQPSRRIVPGLGDFVRDLEQIEQEFGGYDHNAKEHCIEVWREPPAPEKSGSSTTFSGPSRPRCPTQAGTLLQRLAGVTKNAA